MNGFRKFLVIGILGFRIELLLIIYVGLKVVFIENIIWIKEFDNVLLIVLKIGG